MKNLRRILISFSAFVFLVIFGALSLFSVKDRNKKENLQILKIGNQEFLAEVAADALSQARGLSGRESLPENRGMLFVFNDMAERSFWMVGMKFPLDIIWIKGDRVVGVSENLPPAAGINSDLYNSPEPVDKVLEINAGLSRKLNLKIGDRLTPTPN